MLSRLLGPKVAVAVAVTAAAVITVVCVYTQPPLKGGVARAARAACQGPRLIIHVGPPKTGTSALQNFLGTQAPWLQEEFGVTVGFQRADKEACVIIANSILTKYGKRSDRVTETSSKRMEAAVNFTNSKLQEAPLVVISSEGFSLFGVDEWTYLFSLLKTSNTCVSAVVAHRGTTSWIASWWVEQSKRNSNPISWGSFLQDYAGGRIPDDHGDTDPHLQLLNVLHAVFLGAVDGVSYEYLREANSSMAAFFVCNATLRRTGQSWTECRDAVNRRSAKAVYNKSPMHAAVDVTRLARTFYQARQTLNRCSTAWPSFRWGGNRALIPLMPQVSRVAEQLPLTCGTFDGLFLRGTDEWFVRTGAIRPKSGFQNVCTVDEAKLGPQHWQMIGALVPECY